VAGVVAVTLLLTSMGLPGAAEDTPAPASVAVAGDLQSELGCASDWDPACTQTELVNVAGSAWKSTFALPAGDWEYKVALNDSWDENYGAGGARDGANIPLGLDADTDVSFYYSHTTHWVTDNVNTRIVTAPGSYQSELACPGDWQPECLLSWLEDPDGDGVFTLSTAAIPAGDYEVKAAIGESWDENYGEGGVANGPNITFTVARGQTVTFEFVSATNTLTVEAAGGGGIEPGDEDLVTAPVRPDSDEVVYFVMTDRFANGDPGNDTGGDTSGDPLVNGFLPTDKGFHHGGDLAGLMSQLDYLQGLGVTAIWITPPFANDWIQGDGTIAGSSSSYHGYWQVDYTTIDPHFGTNAEMQDFVAAAHDRGIKVLFDIVLNHTGDVITYEEGVFTYRNKTDYPYRDADGNVFDDRDYAGTDTFPTLDPAVSFPYTPVVPPGDEDAKNPAWLNDPIYYHNRGDSTFSGENSLYGDFFGLDDLFTEHPDVVAGMIDVHTAMITEFGIDGFRVDTVKHVNDEFWEAFVPAVLDHAAAEGKTDFVMFGEVFGETVEFRSRYSTGMDFPGTLDFGFDGAAKQFAASSGATSALATFFATDDWYTDTDSNAFDLAKFIGNHDLGRFGLVVRNANPGASDAEVVARVALGQSLNFLTRGRPVIYYGDEQGFVGDGGDKDARQDMMPSQVASYNDDDLIGTDATTGDDNFDTAHVLYATISDLAALRAAHPALATGAQITRASADAAGVFAFSRIDRTEQVEYVVALNNSESAASATFDTDTSGAAWTEVYPGGGAGLSSDASGSLTVDLDGLSVAVYRADTTIDRDDTASIVMTAPAAGAEVTGRVPVSADPGAGYAEVTFAVSVDGGDYQVIGTDDNAPYTVYHDVTGLAVGTTLTYKAIVADAAANLASAKVAVTVGEEEPPPTSDVPYAIIHYLRDDGDYGDHTTGDFNDFWGLHLWGDAIDPAEVTEWTSPKPFLGEDEYGRFAWIRLQDPTQPVNFIVHRGDTKDGTDADRLFDPAVTPEVWLRQGDPTAYPSQAEAQGFVTIRYQRPDGDYGDPTSDDFNDFWGLHLWGDGIDPAEATEWTTPKKPDGVDDYGAYWTVDIADPDQPVSFIVHRGDEKDPGPDQSMIPAADATIWLQSGDETLHPTRGAAEGYAAIHYHRADGDYGDPTSDDFNDFWGLHVWEGAASPNPSWQEPVRPAGFDLFGPYWEIDLADGATQLAYIIHRGDTKDPGPDQFLELDVYGHEVWQLENADPEAPYILPLLAGTVSRGDLTRQQAHWVDETTIVWPSAEDTSAAYGLCWSAEGGLELTDSGIGGGECVALTLSGTFPAEVEGFRHLGGLPTLEIGEDDRAAIPEMVRGQVAVVAATTDGVRIDATGLQIPGVLDDLYATDTELGVVWDGEVPTIRLWAPTARSVTMRLYDDSTTNAFTEIPMTAEGGVWSAAGQADWKHRFYTYAVEVYVPSTGTVETNVVTDPYSLSLSMNSTRTQIVDLNDAELAPAGWNDVDKPPLTRPEDVSVYELHIRDFSVSDLTVPEQLRGTYGAFTVEGSNGMQHLAALAEAGLSFVHLLPAFDIATIDEDRSTWQAPDPAVLAGYPPDSEEQQAAVTATADLDGFNWGYDPLHYTTPEGSYATDPDGTARIGQFREMVQAINQTGLRVVMDVVYNHTNAAGQSERSVLDRIVPGYYHRLDENGAVTTSTCCPNTASEHQMMSKLMIDSVVTWARDYKVDAFRFDLMGHHSRQNMLDLRAALDQLTIEEDGVDGSAIYLYGEGWNFGEVANDARFVQATQHNMAGTGIGTFSDRLRDAVRGGGPFDDGQALVTNQGFINGLWYDSNGGLSEEAALDELLLSADQIRVGLAGNLADYTFVDRNGDTVTGSQVDYNGQPAGYTDDPQEHIVYVSKHDNQTLFDIGQYHHPVATSMEDRVRAQNLGMDFTALSQGVPFFHAGVDMLRSKSLDRDSFNSGDWFNRLDFTYQSNNWGVGLPVAEKNQSNWGIQGPLLANPDLMPAPEHIAAAAAHYREILAVRSSSALFRLETAADVQERLTFQNTGPDQIPGLIVMTLSDEVGVDLDPDAENLVVLFNVTDEEVVFDSELDGTTLALHPVLADSADPVVQTTGYDAAGGTFTIPARTTAVFVEEEPDTTAPEAHAELDLVRGRGNNGIFAVDVTCTDRSETTLTIDINGITVAPGQEVWLTEVQQGQRSRIIRGMLRIWAPSFEMTATCTDAAGNSTTVVVKPGFVPARVE
jgi:pullulanase-type alpha-1,6-glucosidase